MCPAQAASLELGSALHTAEQEPRSRIVDARTARFTAAVEKDYDLVWRNLRRLGVPQAEVDDAVQEVILAFARRLDDIEPGVETGFLLVACTFVAKRVRRRIVRRQEVDDEVLNERVDARANPEQRAVQSEARARLQEILDELPYDFRCVFVLFEMEQLSKAEVAKVLGLPEGTVSSRIHRARKLFERAVQRRNKR
ncbi:MAG: polymerase sigma factor RpoE [Labilithrix sp.]|nr:polymerase sigma factor RpoE [Labilithrix sp.]